MTPLLLATLALASPAAIASQSSRASSAPAAPAPYPVFAWRSGGPPADAAWARALRELGFTGTNVQGAEPPSVATDLGLELYADFLAPRATFHRDPDDPAWVEQREAFEQSRSIDSMKRDPCLDDADVVDAARETAAARARRAAAAGARFLSVADEPSFTVGASPIDFDRSPAAIASFRASVKERFASPEALARAWGSARVPLDAVEPWTTDAIRAREWAHGPPWSFAPWNAAREHADASFARALGAAIEAARAAAPGVPVGFLGAQPPSAFGGYDWGRLLAARPDVLEVYDVAGARDLVRAMAPRTRLADTFFAEATGLAPAQMSWSFARGGRAAIVWANAALFTGGDVAAPSEFARAVGARARALRALAPLLDRAARETDSVGLVLSAPSVRLGWLFDARGDGASWPRRLTSYEYEHSTMLASLESWLALLDDLGVAPAVVDARELARAASLPRVLILPRCAALAGEEVAALRAHVERGGSIVAEGRPALFDGDLTGGGPRGALDDLFGAGASAFSGFADENARPAASAARSTDGLVVLEPRLATTEGAPLLLARGAGGRASLLNLSTIEYRDDRLDAASARARALRDRIAPLLAPGIDAPRVRVVTSAALPIAAYRERRGADLFVLVAANVRRRPEVALRVDRSIPVALAVDGRAPSSVVRLDGGERPLARDADGRYAFDLDPFHLALLRVRF